MVAAITTLPMGGGAFSRSRRMRASIGFVTRPAEYSFWSASAGEREGINKLIRVISINAVATNIGIAKNHGLLTKWGQERTRAFLTLSSKSAPATKTASRDSPTMDRAMESQLLRFLSPS